MICFNIMISFLLFDIIYQNIKMKYRMNSNINTKNNLYKI